MAVASSLGRSMQVGGKCRMDCTERIGLWMRIVPVTRVSFLVDVGGKMCSSVHCVIRDVMLGILLCSCGVWW